MKKVLVSAALVAASFVGFAQDNSKPLHFSIGVEGALPLGDFGDSHSFGIGGSAQGNYNLDDNLALTLNAGYLSFSGKKVSTTIAGQTYTVENKALGVIPVLGGIEYKFNDNIFASAQLGMSFINNGGGSAFTYAPGLGFKFGENFGALVKYTGMSKNGGSLNTIGARVFYSF